LAGEKKENHPFKQRDRMNQEIFLAIICSTLLILLLVAIVVIVLFVSGRQKAKQEMEMTRTKLSYEQELRKVETEVKEQVMGQFAQELHDNIGQLLTAMHIQIENQKLDHPSLTEGLKPVEIYLDEVTRQLKLLSRTLNNDYLGHIGLFSAMQLEADRLTALRRFTVHFPMVQGSTHLDKNNELMVFRIFQEITQNALRHSAAKNLYINVDTSGENFELRVKDDGKGFDSAEILASSKASGLRNIIKRAKLAGLECEIIGSPGNGCLFKLKKVSTLVS
jgi:two-component system NarL family sensor kinase